MRGFDFINPEYAPVLRRRSEMLKSINGNPSKIASLRKYYSSNIAQFITDWGMTFDPRNIERGLPATVPFILFPRQVEWVEWVVNDGWKLQVGGLSEKSRDMGLSWLSVAVAASMCILHNDLVVGFGSRKQEYVDNSGDPKSLFWKAREFVMLLPPFFRGGMTRKTAPFMRVNFPESRSSLVGEAGDNIGRGNRASIYFVDEAAFLERPRVTDAALSQTTNCRIDISTPNGLNNPFAEKIHSGRHRVFRFHWRDDPRKSDEWYEKQRKTLEPVVVAQEIDLNYSASVEGVVIPSEWVQSAIDAHKKLGFDGSGERRASLDVADKGRDLNALGYREGFIITQMRKWHGTSVDDIYGTTQKCIDHCDEDGFEEFDYDSDGLGAACEGNARVINETRETDGYRKISATAFHGSAAVLNPDDYAIQPNPETGYQGKLNKNHYGNYKAQQWFRLREFFENTHKAVVGQPFDPDFMISLSSEMEEFHTVTSELSQPTFKKNGQGKIIVDKAPDETRSPNCADVVMMLRAEKPEKEVSFWDL